MNVFTQPVWRGLVFALLHTLWQGGLIALGAAALLRSLPARRQDVRYATALGAQAGVLLAGIFTWAVLGYESPRPVPSDAPAVVQGAEVIVVQGGTQVGVAWSPARDATPDWVSAVAAAWLTGVALMLARAVVAAVAATGLARHSQAVGREVTEAVRRLERELGIGRAVRVVGSVCDAGPAAFGLVWPTVVLPVSMLTGLSPDAIRAVLAHELAHVRRYDYAVNLAQMFVESLLFFNPVVWWLGRQARLEREACCDAVAVRLTGGPVGYSRILADWAGRVPLAAAGWGGNGWPSTVRERVLRVLRPGEAPGMRLSWTSLLLLLVVGPLLLVGLRRGADRAVVLAAQVLSPAERVEKLKAAHDEYASPESATDANVTLKGTIRGPGGEPIDGKVAANAFSEAGSNSQGTSLDALGKTFSVQVRAGVIWIFLDPEDFAPMILGPFRARPEAIVEGVDVVLEKGFPAQVRVVDEQGKPVPGATLSGGLTNGGASMHPAKDRITGADGVYTFAHAAKSLYGISAQAPGFRPGETAKIHLSPDSVTTLILARARPTTGILVGPDGQPVDGARIRPLIKSTENFSINYGYGPVETLLATTGRDGRFRIDTLDDAPTRYTLLIESERYGRSVVSGIQAGQEDLKWTVGPKRTVTGTIQGNLKSLRQERGKPIIDVTEHYPVVSGRASSGALLTTSVPVAPIEGGGRFQLEGVLAGELTVTAGGHVVKLNAEKADNPVTLDLTQPLVRPATRRVVIRLKTPAGSPTPAGSVVAYAVADERERAEGPLNLPFMGSEVSFDAPIPGMFSYDCQSVIGYWFKPGSVKVSAGDTPLTVEVDTLPAGAVVGRVFEADGSPAVAGVSLGSHTVERPPGLKWDESVNLQNVGVDVDGRFFLGPLPVGGTYVAVAGRGHNKRVSKPLRLDGSTATVRVDLRLTEPVAAGGRVIGPDGMPVAGASVTLSLEHPQAGTTWNPPAPTGPDGAFRFDDLSAALGQYMAKLDLRKDYQPAKAALNPGGQDVVIRLERGHILNGRVVDVATGKPIPGVELYATRNPIRPDERFAYGAEEKTDGEGRFRFSNLAPGAYQLNDRDGLKWESDLPRAVTADQPGRVEVPCDIADVEQAEAGSVTDRRGFSRTKVGPIAGTAAHVAPSGTDAEFGADADGGRGLALRINGPIYRRSLLYEISHPSRDVRPTR